MLVRVPEHPDEVPEAALPVGMNARLFPSNWRPVAEEIAFAAAHGFDLLQLPGPEHGLDAERLGATPARTGPLLAEAALGAVMEIVLRVGGSARTAAGASALDVLRANLPPLRRLGAR